MGKFRQFFKHWLTHIVFTAGLDQIRDFAAQKPKQREKERDIEKNDQKMKQKILKTKEFKVRVNGKR